MTKWIKRPGPGQFRGEGQWEKIPEHSSAAQDYWDYCKASGYLPTREQDTKPYDD